MLSLVPDPLSRLSRRSWLEWSARTATGPLAIASGVVGLGDRVRAAEGTRSGTSREARARGTAQRGISIFLCGGPSQPDLWDLKLDAPVGIKTEFSPIATAVPGLPFGELLPLVARQADKLCLVRSMTHANNDHNGAIAHALMGQLPRLPTEFYADRGDHPGVGGILHKVLGPVERLPAWVVLPRPFTTYSPHYKGQSGGFLGPAYDPLMFSKEAKGSLTDAPLQLDALALPGGVTAERLRQRAGLLTSLGEGRTVAETGEGVGGELSRGAEGVNRHYEQAFELLDGAAARGVFDLEREPVAVRDRYGRNEYGQSLLMARRLVESGVRFVNVFWTFFDTKGCQFNLWDNHGVPNDVCGIDGQLTGRQQLTHSYCTPSFDRSFSALLEELDERGLLAETLVSVSGEFGRTPRINGTAGRDHWAHCYTNLLAGGGVRGGAVYGASDAQGAYVKENPVTPEDYAATLLHAFGVAGEEALLDSLGRPVRASTGVPVTAIFG